MNAPPFYVVSSGSSGDEFSDGNTPNTSLSGLSHDTSRAKYHIQDLAAFAEELNTATKKAFPNRGRTRYDSVHACLIRWEEDDLFVEPELRRLNNVFQDYGFSTNIWEIPSRNSHLDLMMKTGQFLQSFDSDKNLFIVYYGGHGRIDSERQAEWTCKRDPSYAKVRWSAIQAAFAEAMSDTLILLDTCAAASATTRSQHGSMEVIMASGFEAKAPPPGEHSFTNALVDVLESWVRRPSFSASCLHAEILTELKMKPRKKGREGTKLEWCVTPIHLNCTQTSTALGIELCRRNILPRGHVSAESEPSDNSNPSTDAMSLDFICSDNNSPSPLSALSPTGKYETPHVLISVAIEEDQPDLDVKKTAQWLESIPFLAKWTKVECAFPSYSTLLVLSLPVVIWNMLPDHPACSFIGYVTAPNLIATSPPSLEDEICDGKMRRGGVKSEPKLEDEGLPMRSEISQPISHQTCIDEIKDLDPTSENDSKDNVWLSTENSIWPPSADIRIKSFMHERNFYPSKDPAGYMLTLLIIWVTDGIQVQTCGTKQYISLMERLADRVLYWVKNFLDKALIKQNVNGTFDKSDTFKSYWDKRHETWGKGRPYGVLSPYSTRESSPVMGTSVISSKFQQSMADSGYWTAGRQRDSEFPGNSTEFSEIEDPFFGVNFEAGVQRIDSLPAAALGNDANQRPLTNPHQPDLQDLAESTSASAHIDDSGWSDDSWKADLDPGTIELLTTYPLSPLPNIKEITDNPSLLRDEDDSWRAGLAPESRTEAEVPTLKQQEEQRRIDIKNDEIQEWRSQAGDSDDAEDEPPFFGPFTPARNAPRDPGEEYNNIPPVDDSNSIHENRLQEGQVYFRPDVLNEVDSKLLSRPRQFNDPPSLPYATKTTLQPPTSNEAIAQWNRGGNNISLVSLAASWGTRRRSEPSLLDYNDDQGKKGNFLTLIKSKIKGNKTVSIFDQGIDRIANMIRKRSDSKLKRARTAQDILGSSRQNSQGTLAPPPRTSSFGKRPMPSINTALAATSGSTSATPTSPKSPVHLGLARSVMSRVRSRSELLSQDKRGQSGLAAVWRSQDGPPVPSFDSSLKVTDYVTSGPEGQHEKLKGVTDSQESRQFGNVDSEYKEEE